MRSQGRQREQINQEAIPMTPTAPRTLAPQIGVTHRGRNALVLLGAIVLIGAIAVAGVLGFQAANSPRAEVRPAAGEAVDGWLPGITAANRAVQLDQARPVQDGWSSYLLTEEREAVDGWSSYLLREEQEATDGWASRYLVSDDD
jgi:hypothetical protein